MKWFKPGMPIKVIVKDKNTIILQPGNQKGQPEVKKKKKIFLLSAFAYKDSLPKL